jgi:hypothetical protein
MTWLACKLTVYSNHTYIGTTPMESLVLQPNTKLTWERRTSIVQVVYYYNMSCHLHVSIQLLSQHEFGGSTHGAEGDARERVGDTHGKADLHLVI